MTRRRLQLRATTLRHLGTVGAAPAYSSNTACFGCAGVLSTWECDDGEGKRK